MEVSKDLDYNLSRETLMRRVIALFDPDDNLLQYPLFKPAQKGEWAKFVKEHLGDGIYIKLQNVEQDLDCFYAKLEAAAQKKYNGKLRAQFAGPRRCFCQKRRNRF